jgi:hypothetical protein
MTKLTLYDKYTRKEVHDYFVPGGTFTPNAGTWGLHGCVQIPDTSHDYVFFVTYGQSQGDHFFQEGISKDGVIAWQSQPRQHLNEARILKWIEQQARGDLIYLFVRSRKGDPYTYFGKINYLSHDPFKEYPVWFEFRLEEWSAPNSVLSEFVRTPTVGLGEGKTHLPSQTQQKTRKVANQTALKLSSYDEHVRNLLTSNPHLIDVGEGYRWESDYEFDLGDCADIVFFGPGREAKIIAICTSEQDISYLKAVQSKLWRAQLCFERGEDENSEFIQCYLVAKSVNENTRDFCSQYGVHLLIV